MRLPETDFFNILFQYLMFLSAPFCRLSAKYFWANIDKFVQQYGEFLYSEYREAVNDASRYLAYFTQTTPTKRISNAISQYYIYIVHRFRSLPGMCACGNEFHMKNRNEFV